MALVLGGYQGAVYPVALELAGGTSLTWSEAAATEATMSALSGALLAAAVLIVPGLLVLYSLFSRGLSGREE